MISYVQIFRKTKNQTMLIRSNLENASALFQNNQVKSNDSDALQHQVQGAATFPIGPQDKPVEIALNFYHPAQRDEKCKLLDPTYARSGIKVMTVS
jgi:hypothetical protein